MKDEDRLAFKAGRSLARWERFDDSKYNRDRPYRNNPFRQDPQHDISYAMKYSKRVN